MRKYILLITLLTCSQIYSQNTKKIKDDLKEASKSELLEYVSKAKSQGITLDQAKKVIINQGGSNDEVNMLVNLWNNEDYNSNISDSNFSQPIESNIGFDKRTDGIDSKDNRFSSEFFNNKNISETPQLYLATPQDYRLGPGDEIIINIFGSSEDSFLTEISREGNIKLERLSPVYLSGLSISNAKKRLRDNLSKIFPALKSNEDSTKADIDVSLVKARSIVVNIVGSVKVPGTYTISGFSSVLNALYISGGPNNIGSYRNIEIIRSGKKIKNIDLYDYFSKGIYPSFYLRDQDVIFVPPLKKEVVLKEGFKINKKFELKDEDTFKNVLSLSGGFMSEAYKEKIYVERINGIKIDYEDIDFRNYETSIPKDGDIVSAKIPNEFFENKVSITGRVLLPGDYSLKDNKTVEDLISSANGFTRDALISRAFLYRKNSGVTNELISLNLNSANDTNIRLQVMDSLVINSNKDLLAERFVEVVGEVKNDTIIPYKNNMSIVDAIVLGGGFSDQADRDNIKVFRNSSTIGDGNQLTEVINVKVSENYTTENNILLVEGDLVSVSKKEFFQDIEYFSVQGEVAKEAFYAIENESQSINDVFKKIRLKKTADYNGIYLVRDSIKIPIELDKNYSVINNLNLQGGDVINIPEKNNSVKIIGEVQNEIIIPYNKSYSLNNYISFAGGYSSLADKKNVYVTYANGSSKSIKVFLGFRINPKIYPGSTIYISEKQITEKTSFSEVIGITSSLASLVALIQILSNN